MERDATEAFLILNKVVEHKLNAFYTFNTFLHNKNLKRNSRYLTIYLLFSHQGRLIFSCSLGETDVILLQRHLDSDES